MSFGAATILTAFALVMIVGPAALWLYGRFRHSGAVGGIRWDWSLAAASLLTYILAFNLVFFIQELFLVLPKALTPGLRPTLFHNNHDWTGSNPLAELFQGTGALAIILTGLGFALALRRPPGRTATGRLMAIWMAYHGLMQGLPQFAAGAAVPGNDVGRAMTWLGLDTGAKLMLGIAALALVPLAAFWIARALLSLLPPGASGPGAQRRFMLNVATLPAIAAIPLIILYRVPRETLEVVLPPILVTWIGIAWIQAGAWRTAPPVRTRIDRTGLLVAPLAAAALLLAVFHLILRPGIAFF